MKRMLYGVIVFLALASVASVSGLQSGVLGNDIWTIIEVYPNITQITENNTYYYSGGFAPHTPWLYNDTTDIYFNYSRLIFEFYNSSQTDALLNAQDECSEISGCVVGAITTSYNATYHGFYISNRTSTSNSSGYWDNLDSPLATWTDTFNSTYHAYWLLNKSNSTLYWNGLLTPPSSWTDTYNVTYDAKWDSCADASACGWLTVETEWRGNATAALNQTATDVQCVDCVTASDIGAIGDCSNICTDATGETGSSFNQTYHDYWLLNATNKSSYWDNLDAPLSAWTDTFNTTYDTHVSSDDILSCDDADTCGYLTEYTDTFLGNWSTYHNAEWDKAYSYTTNGSFVATLNSSIPEWNKATAAYAYATNNSFIATLNSSVGNWNKAYSYTTNGTFLQSYYNVSYDAAFKYATNGTFINYLNSSVSVWNSWANNYTACDASSKLYFNGRSLACAADATGGSGGGANVSTTTCSGTQKVSAINNATGVVTCSADTDTNTYNTTQEMFNAANNGTFINYLNSSVSYWNSWTANYTACTSTQKLYFNGRSLACNNDIDTNTYNTTQEMFNAANNGTFIQSSNASLTVRTTTNMTAPSLNLSQPLVMCSNGNCWKLYINSSDYFIIEGI